MDVHGTYSVTAKPADLWRALGDLPTLCHCLPGCESITRIGPHEAEVVFAARLNGVHSRFTGKVHWSEVEEGRAFTLACQMQSSSAGTLQGRLMVTLVPHGVDCQVTVHGKATPSGRLAALGPRGLEGVAGRVLGQVLDCLTAAAARGGVSGVRRPDMPSLPGLEAGPVVHPVEATPDPGLRPAGGTVAVAPFVAAGAPPHAGPVSPVMGKLPEVPERSERAKTRILATGTVLWLGILFVVFGLR